MSGKLDIKDLAPAIEKLAKELLTPAVLLTKAALIVEAASKMRAPSKTGTLRRDINSRVEGNAAYVGNAVKYSPFVHDGTSKMPARPYIQWGIEDSQSQLEQMMVDTADLVFSKVGR